MLDKANLILFHKLFLINLLTLSLNIWGTDTPFIPNLTHSINTPAPQNSQINNTFVNEPIRNDPLSLLPIEILFTIFDQLNIEALLNLSATNQYLYTSIYAYFLRQWENITREIFLAVELITPEILNQMPENFGNPLNSFYWAEIAEAFRFDWPKKWVAEILTPEQQTLLYTGAPLWIIIKNNSGQTPYEQLLQITNNDSLLTMAFFLERPETPLSEIQHTKTQIYQFLNQKINYELVLLQSTNTDTTLPPIILEWLFIQNHWEKGKGLNLQTQEPTWLMTQLNWRLLHDLLTHIHPKAREIGVTMFHVTQNKSVRAIDYINSQLKIRNQEQPHATTPPSELATYQKMLKTIRDYIRDFFTTHPELAHAKEDS